MPLLKVNTQYLIPHTSHLQNACPTHPSRISLLMLLFLLLKIMFPWMSHLDFHGSCYYDDQTS